MDLNTFCLKLQGLNLDHTKKALAILWFHDEKSPEVSLTSGQLAKTIHEAGLGAPHSTQLGEAVRRSGMVLASSSGFRLKMIARQQIREWLQPILAVEKPTVDQDLGYLPRAVWENTRGYIEK